MLKTINTPLDLVSETGLVSCITMNVWTRKFLLITVVLALAVSPLRGSLASPVMAAADDTMHCDQMQTVMQSPDHMAGMQDSATDDSDHDCDQGCGGNCCDGACNTCAHGSIALSSPITVSSETPNKSLTIAPSYGVSGRTVHPPFRPPISLLS